MARLTNKALTKQNNGRQGGASKSTENHFDSSECRFLVSCRRKQFKSSWFHCFEIFVKTNLNLSLYRQGFEL